MKKSGMLDREVELEALDALLLVLVRAIQYDWWMDVKRPRDEAWFMIFVTLWYVGVEEDNVLKWKSTSTSIVYGLKYSTNIDSHLVEELVINQVVGKCFALH
jgi:hypothetical protein